LKKSKNILISIFCIVFLLAGSVPPLYGAVKVPAPSELFYVADFAGVLSGETTNYIIEQNDNLYLQTGAQIVVATVDFLDGAEIEDYAYTMFNQWGIGSEEKNNGILLLLVIGEENYWIVQGKGLEERLSSGLLGDLLYEYLEPDFAKGDYDAGVRKTFDALLEEMGKIYDFSPAGEIGSGEKAENSGSQTGGQETTGRRNYTVDKALVYALLLLLIFFWINRRTQKKIRRLNQGYGRRRGDRNIVIIPGPTVFRPARRNPGFPFGGFFGPKVPTYPSDTTGTAKSGNNQGTARSGGGGQTRGGGAGRNTFGGFGSFGGGSGLGGGGFRSGGFKSGGGFRGGGGGSTRGGGAGRR